MDQWKFESNTKKYFFLACALFLVGGVLMYGFRDFDVTHFADSTAGFFLGVFLSLLSSSLLFTPYYEVTTIDSLSRSIVIRSKTLFGEKVKKISADVIESARVAFIGRASNFIGNTYYISLHMRDGSYTQLFLSGYYDGRTSENVLKERLMYLEKALGIMCEK